MRHNSLFSIWQDQNEYYALEVHFIIEDKGKYNAQTEM